MNRPWFDTETGILLLDEYVTDMPSYQKILADDVVTDAEVAGQARQAIALLGELEEKLSPEARSLATDALCQLALLYALERERAARRSLH
jgi:hypothetical protein